MLLLSAALPAVARAAEESSVLLLRAEQLAAEDRCDEALPVVREARGLGPDSARAALLEGQCAMRMRLYADAIRPLESARSMDPELAEATLQLGIAHYQLENDAAAERELEAAAAELPDRAEVHLYRGLLLLKRGEARQAAAALEQARSLDPGFDPATSYFAGRAWQVAKERERAESDLQRVIDEHPGTSWADEAERALASARSRYQRRSFWGRLTAGMEYDSNVVLKGAGVVLPSNISDQEDGRGVWITEGGVELFRNDVWAGGVLGRYYGNAHVELGDYNAHYPGAALWVDRLLDEDTYLRFQPDFGYGWVDGDDFLLTAGATAALHRDWQEAGEGRFVFRFERRDYRFSIQGNPTLDRDGYAYAGSYDHAWSPADGTQLRASVGAHHYDSERGEYDAVGPGVRLGARQELPADFAFEADFAYAHDFYLNRSGFTGPPPSKRRDDDIFLVSAAVEHELTQNLRLSLRYQFHDNTSNVPFFDYERHIVGGYVTLHFGPVSPGPFEGFRP
jgi:tetratricopeptide (TPR) repeat protein